MATEVNPYTRRSRVLAVILRYGGGLFIFAGLADLVLGFPGQLIELEFPWSLAVSLGCIGLGSLAVLVSGKFDPLSAEELIRRDPRPPVLYLRSFEQDRAVRVPFRSRAPDALRSERNRTSRRTGQARGSNAHHRRAEALR